MTYPSHPRDQSARKWRGRQSSPLTGKLSARPAGQPGYLIAKESLRRSLPRTSLPTTYKNYTGRPVCVFEGMSESIGPMWSKPKPKPNPGAGTEPPPAGRPRAQAQERVGRTTPLSSSAMSSARLFLDRVARQQSPSPLHRQPDHVLTCNSDSGGGSEAIWQAAVVSPRTLRLRPPDLGEFGRAAS
jgi:hypothetical protein